MAILIHLPDEKKSLAIPDCDSLHELSRHESKSLQKVAYSHIFFQKIFGYIELVHRGEISQGEAEGHIEEFAELYRANILDFDHTPEDEIANKVFNVMKEDEFGEKYGLFLNAVSSEIFKIFASGAISYKEGDTELETMPQYMNFHVPTKA